MDRYRTLCLMFQLAFLLSNLLLNDCRKLEGYEFPVYTTEFCPSNETAWEARSSIFNCTKGSIYTCLPNENITELLEFCYPEEIIHSHKGICLYLRKDTSEVDSYSCTHFERGCPTGYYSGSTIYEYASCVSIGNGCFLDEKSCKRPTEARVQRTYTPEAGTTEGGLSHLVWESSTPHTVQGSDDRAWVWMLIVVIGVLSLVFAVIGIYFYIHRQTN